MPDTLKCKPIVPEMYQDNIHKNNDLDENVDSSLNLGVDIIFNRL